MARRGATITLKHVHRFADRHGKERCYYRRAGYPRVALPGAPGSAEFMAAYAAASEAKEAPARLRGGAGSFDRLVSSYYQSTQFKDLKPTTARVYRQILDSFCEKHGRRLVRQMKRRHVDAMLGEMTPGAANSFLKRLKTLMVFAMDNEWLDRDPTYRMKGRKTGEIHSWTEEQIAFFEAHWEIGTKERLAFELALGTAQRRSDLCKMRWRDYDGQSISVTQEKTGAQLAIPVDDFLKSLLDSTERKGETILVTNYGKPFASPAAFGNWFADAVRAVSLLPKECSLHGLRKAALRRLAEAGCSTHEVAAVGGHASLQMVQHYTKAAEQKALAKAAVAKQKRHRSGKPKSA